MVRAVRSFCGLFLLTVGWTGSLAGAAEWADQRTAGHFHLQSNFTLANHTSLTRELERLEEDVDRALEIGGIEEPIHLLLFADQRSYRRYLDHYFRGAPVRRALFIKGTGPGWVFAYQNEQFEVDVRHESTHALLHALLPMVPLWLDEGLAEYYEVPAQRRVYDNPHMSATRWAAWFYRLRSLRQLEELDDVRHMGKAEYRAAWAWVHFMLHGPPEAHQVLVHFLRDIRDQVPPGNLSERMRQAMPDFEKKCLEHFRRFGRP